MDASDHSSGYPLPFRHAILFGGSGFIGTHLGQYLRRNGTRVTIADLEPPRASEVHGYEMCDVRQPIRLDAPEADLVVNLAAIHRTPGHHDHEYYDTNVAGALNVAEWARRQEISTICFTSSISVYGPAERPVTEQSPLSPSSAYGRSKLLAEQIHCAWRAEDAKRRLVIVRPAVVFGPGERGNFTRLARALARRRFVYPGRDDTVKACGYVDDLVRAITFALAAQPEPSFVFNYAYPQAYTIGDICTAFSRVAGYPSPVSVPPGLVDAFERAVAPWATKMPRSANLGRIRKLTTSTYVVPARLLELGFTWETDIESALSKWRTVCAGGDFG